MAPLTRKNVVPLIAPNGALPLANKSDLVLDMIVVLVSAPQLNSGIPPYDAMRMTVKVAIFAPVEPMCWIPFPFTYLTVVTYNFVFNSTSIGEL